MEENTERKKVNRVALAVFGIGLMFFNYGLARIMANEPFAGFVIMAFLTNIVMALGFIRIYRTITRKDDK